MAQSDAATATRPRLSTHTHTWCPYCSGRTSHSGHGEHGEHVHHCGRISKGPHDGVRHRASVQVRANASGAPSDSVVRSAALAAETHHRDNTARRQPACERRDEQPDHAPATARATCASTRLEVATSSEHGSQACGARCARIAARASWPCRSRRLRRDQHVLAVRADHAPRCARMRAPARALRAR